MMTFLWLADLGNVPEPVETPSGAYMAGQMAEPMTAENWQAHDFTPSPGGPGLCATCGAMAGDSEHPHDRAVTETERILAEMLTANTGAHFLDSGGAYGRQWQATRAKYGLDSPPNSTYSGAPIRAANDPTEPELERVARAMRAEPDAYISDFGDVEISAFHWIAARLEYDADADAAFRRYARHVDWHVERDSRREASWPMLAEDFVRMRAGHAAREWGYSAPKVWSENTYNHDNRLDRTLQWASCGEYVALQVHGGADVRGGYTRPYVFRIIGADISDAADAEYVPVAVLGDFANVYVSCAGVARNADIPDGQLTADGVPVDRSVDVHSWDAGYDGWHLYAAEDTSRMLTFDRGAEPDAPPTAEPEEYDRRLVSAYDVARQNDAGVWTCPYDGTALVAVGPFPSC
jgi:hypothetical protein